MVKKIVRYLAERARYENSVRQLSMLTDRELADIGISRSDIYAVAREDMIRKSR